MAVENHIRQLLFERDCVIIPHFGGLVGNYKSSKLDRIQNKFSPPSKEISFNKNLTHNDGLLANRISVEEKISYEEANLQLKKFAEELKISLKQGKKIEFEQIGILFSDEHQNLQFEPDYAANYLVDSFGLTSFHSPAVKKAGIKSETSLREKISEVKFTDRTPVPDTVPGAARQKKITLTDRAKKYFTYTAAALPLLLFLLWMPFNIEKLSRLGQKAKSINYSNLVPFIEKPAAVYSERKDIPHSFSDRIDSAILPGLDSNAISKVSFFEKDEPEYSEDKKIIVRLKESPGMEGPSGDMAADARYRFHVIGGCFQYFENAEKLVEKLRNGGFNAAIVDKHRGLYRVCYQSFTARNEALSLLAKVQSSDSGNNAWLLVK